MTADPFHADELAAQRLAGGGAGGAGIRDAMPPQHRAFFESLPWVALAGTDAAGAPRATLLGGPPGFIQAPEPQRLRIAADAARDPVLAGLAAGAPVGLLGLDFASRRRNRANGRLLARDATGLDIAVAESFGNCPQYIHRRLVAPVPRQPKPAQRLSSLDAAAMALIDGADTLFVASRARAALGGGVDISHRGGPAGFVERDGETLRLPDYRGNRYFNTLGNLLGEPRAALLFLDFASGDLLELQGEASIDWQPRDAAPGAERSWSLRITGIERRPAALPLRWTLPAA